MGLRWPGNLGLSARTVLDHLLRQGSRYRPKGHFRPHPAERGLNTGDPKLRRAMNKRVDMALRYQRTNGMVKEVATDGRLSGRFIGSYRLLVDCVLQNFQRCDAAIHNGLVPSNPQSGSAAKKFMRDIEPFRKGAYTRLSKFGEEQMPKAARPIVLVLTKDEVAELGWSRWTANFPPGDTHAASGRQLTDYVRR
jgi:hypothetical protein